MSKSTSATRFILVAITGIVLTICGCAALTAIYFLLNSQTSTSVATSIPPEQFPVSTQIPEQPTQDLEQPTQVPEPAQYVPQYSDFLGKNSSDPGFLKIYVIYCGSGQYQQICPSLGIEFSESNNIVDRVWVYPPGHANFDGYYRGELPNGLVWGDTYADVENKIGDPDAIYNYGWVYTKLGFSIYYKTDAPSIPDPSETIQSIMFFLP